MNTLKTNVSIIEMIKELYNWWFRKKFKNLGHNVSILLSFSLYFCCMFFFQVQLFSQNKISISRVPSAWTSKLKKNLNIKGCFTYNFKYTVFIFMVNVFNIYTFFDLKHSTIIQDFYLVWIVSFTK